MATRRGFIGTVLGAAATGPSVVSGALSRTGPGLGSAIGAAGYPKPRLCPETLLRDLNQMQRMTPEQKQERYGVYRNDIHRQQIESLRSVSASHKTRMIFEADTEANYQSDLKRILRAIAGLETN